MCVLAVVAWWLCVQTFTNKMNFSSPCPVVIQFYDIEHGKSCA